MIYLTSSPSTFVVSNANNQHSQIFLGPFLTGLCQLIHFIFTKAQRGGTGMSPRVEMREQAQRGNMFKVTRQQRVHPGFKLRLRAWPLNLSTQI